jgi:hypothetical protein
MTVVNIDDYRVPSGIGPCAVTFLGFAYKTPEGVEGRLSVSVTIENGDFEAVINTVRDLGGIYIPPGDGLQTFWFLPWPCAAVRIDLVDPVQT